jgi:hypothetical protein
MRIRPWRFAAVAALLVLGLVKVSGGLDATASSVAEKQPSLEQCANAAHDCTVNSPSWQTGNLNQSNSVYAEGDSVPYRATMTGLTPEAIYRLTIAWDGTKNGLRAIDYLTSYNRTETLAVPCDVTTCGAVGPVQTGIPADSDLGSVAQVAGSFTAWGAQFTAPGTVIGDPAAGNLCSSSPCSIGANPSAYSLSGAYTDTAERRISIVFTAKNETVVIAWGGHVASQADWGAGNAASSINGSPYHMRIVGFECSSSTNCGSGQRDRSMNANALAAPNSTTTSSSSSTSSTSTTSSTTTSSSSSTSSTSSTSTTSTTEPRVTTTTAVATVIIIAEPITTTTVAAPELPSDELVIFPNLPSDELVIFPDLPETGTSWSWRIAVAMGSMILGALVLVYAAIRSAGAGVRQ